MEEISAKYYAAERPETPRCLGIKLAPYSLGHRVTLHAYGNSFVTGGEWTFPDLILGVLICSQTFKEWTATRRNPFLGLFLKQVQHRGRGQEVCAVSSRRILPS